MWTKRPLVASVGNCPFLKRVAAPSWQASGTAHSWYGSEILRGKSWNLPILSTSQGTIMASFRICPLLVMGQKSLRGKRRNLPGTNRSWCPLPVNVRNYLISYRSTAKGGKQESSTLQRARGPDRAADRSIRNGSDAHEWRRNQT